jgi:hypothetical protein
MRKWIIGTGVTIAALALGVGAAYGGSLLIKEYRPQIRNAIQNERGDLPPVGNGRNGTGQVPDFNGMPGKMNGQVPDFNGMPGMMNGGAVGPLQGMRERLPEMQNRAQDPRNGDSGTPITMDQAVQAAQKYAAGLGANFQLAQVLEFQNGFYAVITEKDTGRGALEVLIDPTSGQVLPERGPLLMWNLKYGRMGNGAAQTGDNTVTLDQARLAAQAFLDKTHPGAKLNEGGVAFYGYYALVYSVDGKTAGVLGVNGTTQQVWEPAGLGAFVAEKEMAQ